MKTILVSFLLLATGFTGCAQSTCTIKKAVAWYSASMPGAQRVDEQGNPVNPIPIITRFIYVEYSGTRVPEIKAVLYNGIEMQFTVIKLAEKTVWAGDRQLNPGNSMTAKKGNSILKLELQPTDGKPMQETGCKSIAIKSKAGNKTCKFYLGSEKQFATLPMY